MTHSFVISLLAAILLLGSTTPADAQRVCGKRDKIIERLQTKFREYRRSMAIDTDGNLVETFAADNGSWTIMHTKPGGPTCLIITGESWQAMKGLLILKSKKL